MNVLYYAKPPEMNLLPYNIALPSDTVLSNNGHTLPYLKFFKEPRPPTIKYKLDHADMKPHPLSRSPSYIIHAPNACALPNNNATLVVGPMYFGLVKELKILDPTDLSATDIGETTAGDIIGVMNNIDEFKMAGNGVSV